MTYRPKGTRNVSVGGLTARDTEGSVRDVNDGENRAQHVSAVTLRLHEGSSKGPHTQRSCSFSLLESPPPWGKGSLRSMGPAQLESLTRLIDTFLGPGNSFPKHLSAFQGCVGIFPGPSSQGQTVAGTQPWGLQVSKAQLLWAWSEPLEFFYSVDGTRHGRKEDRQQPALFPSPHSSVELPGLKDSKCESGLLGPMERCLFRQ